MKGKAPLLVRDLMTVGVPTCPPDTPIQQLVSLMLEKNWEAMVVLDGSDGQAIGVVNRDDLVRAYQRGDLQTLKAEDVMSDGVPQIPPDIPLTTAAGIMRDRGIRALFLMHNAAGIIYPAAYITYSHFLRHIAAENEEDLSDLGIKARRELPVDAFIQRRDQARRRLEIRKQE